MYDLQVLREKIESFENADEIAAFFKEQDIKGYRGASTSCPIASYFRQAITSVSVGVIGWIGDRLHYKNTGAMTDFVMRFDRNCYPDLKEENSS